jgi:hypothetical protein
MKRTHPAIFFIVMVAAALVMAGIAYLSSSGEDLASSLTRKVAFSLIAIVATLMCIAYPAKGWIEKSRKNQFIAALLAVICLFGSVVGATAYLLAAIPHKS